MARRTLGEFISGYTTSDPGSEGKKFCVETVTGSANRVSITRFSKYVSRFFDRVTKIVSYTH